MIPFLIIALATLAVFAVLFGGSFLVEYFPGKESARDAAANSFRFATALTIVILVAAFFASAFAAIVVVLVHA